MLLFPFVEPLIVQMVRSRLGTVPLHVMTLTCECIRIGGGAYYRVTVQLRGTAYPTPTHTHTKYCFVSIFAVTELPANASLVESKAKHAHVSCYDLRPLTGQLLLSLSVSPVCGRRPLLGHFPQMGFVFGFCCFSVRFFLSSD